MYNIENHVHLNRKEVVYMLKLNHKNDIILLIIISLGVKLALFAYASIRVPSLKSMPDTPTYSEPGINLVDKGFFGSYDERGEIHYEMNRTPGYPLFLGVLHKTLNLSFDSIILIQILLITLAGYIVYRTALAVDRSSALLAAFIFLFDQPTTLASLMLLTEALYAVFISGFIYFLIGYLNSKRMSFLICSVLILAAATYIRPVSYYLGVCLSVGVLYALYRFSVKKALIHALIVLLLFYPLLGVWHYRNFNKTGNADFTVIDNRDLNHMGLLNKYERDGGAEGTGMGPVRYYAVLTAESVAQFFTLPGTFKYFKSEPLRMVSKIFGYPWVFFWLAGLFFARYADIRNQSLLLITLYFMAVSIVVVGLCVGSRFRVPAMPLISILSASGWARLYSIFKR